MPEMQRDGVGSVKRCAGCGKRMFFGKSDYHFRCRRRGRRMVKRLGKNAGRRLPPGKEPPYLP